jgi:4-hydroxybenzoate polyprenyltransferase
MLLIRTFDDIKDEDLDNEIFPNRPVPRGDVLIKDVKILAITSFVILVFINVFFAARLIIPFSLLMVYILLTFKWFFAKELHIKHPKVAMITHQPLPFAIVFFLIQIGLASGNEYSHFRLPHFFLFLVYSLPITAWEVSRKIKAGKNENKYETFSKIFGTTVATSIPIVLYTFAGLISMWIAYYLQLHYSYHFFILTYLIYLNINFIRFLIKPIPKNNNLQKVAMFFTAALFLTLIIFLLIKYSIDINL